MLLEAPLSVGVFARGVIVSRDRARLERWFVEGRPVVILQGAEPITFLLQGGSQVEARLKLLGGDGDRKSTRLNSSHVEISYAVFCLKKNNRARWGRNTPGGPTCAL